MPTDMHCHYLTPDLADALRARTQIPHIHIDAQGQEIFELPEGALMFSSAYTDLLERKEFMDQAGVNRQLLTLPGLFGIDSLPAETAAPLLSAFNDALASACRDHPDHFSGLAALPMDDIGAAKNELVRACETLGLAGAILPGNFFLTYAHAQKLAPLFEAANEIGCHIFIHPGPRPDERANWRQSATNTDNPLHRNTTLNVQANLSQVMVTLALTDFLEPYSNVTVHTANLGGTIPFVIERMDHVVETRMGGGAALAQRFRAVYVDCASLGPKALELAVSVLGADRIVMGTDCPIFRTDWTLKAIHEARITEHERALILDGNARQILERHS